MNNPVIIIAEAGVNHNGSLELAKQLIDAAEAAGADYVKFQTFKTEKNISKSAPKAEYQIKNTGENESQFEMVKKLELSDEEHLELIRYCADKKIKFLSTPFDLESIDFLRNVGITLGKIPSGEMVNFPYLKAMAGAFPHLVMSTGMATLPEIAWALDVLVKHGAERNNITILHCNTEYPTPMQDVNLTAMGNIREEFGVKVGYSDHTRGIEIPTAAVALGAIVIEKHFTLDRTLPGPDHVASLEPAELAAMVAAIRNVEKALGTGLKSPSASEQKNRQIARKSIIAAVPIKKGERFSETNLGTKRPGTGISPMDWEQVVGQTANRDFDADEMIEL
ncbi:N-acetylneuraminate synthase [Chitinophaga caseinilytica]|uniref:N-acetylneuraminate synthase n=1 Tax=Chitinophaga caseinilytica TaxID=2267521 RepID=UPI003C2D4100